MEIENIENKKIENDENEKKKTRKTKVVFVDLENEHKIVGDSIHTISQKKTDISYYNLKQLFKHQNIQQSKKLSMMMNFYNNKYKIYVEKV